MKNPKISLDLLSVYHNSYLKEKNRKHMVGKQTITSLSYVLTKSTLLQKTFKNKRTNILYMTQLNCDYAYEGPQKSRKPNSELA